MASKTETQDRLFEAIKTVTKAIEGMSEYAGPQTQAQALRDLALAYRYAAGGQQPGGVTLTSE